MPRLYMGHMLEVVGGKGDWGLSHSRVNHMPWVTSNEFSDSWKMKNIQIIRGQFKKEQSITVTEFFAPHQMQLNLLELKSERMNW